MILITATGRWATAQTTDILTTGSVGIPVSFNLSSEFDGLSPIAVFKGSGGSYDIAIVPGVVVPHETLTLAGGMLEIGVYARNGDGTIVIPTVWATVGYIREGVAPSGVDPSEPTPDWTAQVQAIATEALEVATEARDDAATGAAAAKASADDAAASAGDAAGYALDASGYATAAETAQGKAEDAQGAADLAASAAKDEADFLRNASATASTLSPGSSATVTLNDGVFTFGIPAGQQGEPGQNGVSPSVSVSPITGGHEVTITDADGSKSFDVLDGEDGNPGTAATVTVGTVTTLPAGSSATVTNVGTSSAAVFDFGIPKGPQGDAGVTSVNTQTGAVVLDAGDIGYDNSETYSSGSVGSEISSVKSAIQNKLDAPATPGTNGQVLTSDGQGGQSWQTPSGGDVTDVQMDSTSIVTDGVANIPVAAQNKLGVVKTNRIYGIDISNGVLNVTLANDAAIKDATASYGFTGVNNQHKAVFYGLSKAAGADLKNEFVTVGTYPEAAKSAISEMLNGAVSVIGTTPTIAAKAGVRYVCGEVSTLTITVPASGIVDVIFQSGSTPTVLTVTPPTGMTMMWAGNFDPASLEADTTYEINIADGCLGVAGSWT